MQYFAIGDLVDFAVLIALYFFVFYKKWKAKGKYNLFVNTAMYVYLGFVLYFTLMPVLTSMPFIFDHPYEPMNLTPFIDVTWGRGDFVRQIILNAVMTIPFGFLLPLVDKKHERLAKVLLYTFLLSLSIELLQPLINGRTSDITDVIMNTVGGVAGYVLYLVFRPVVLRVLRPLKEERILSE